MASMNDRIEHFSGKDVTISFFGALIVAITFIFRGTFIQISVNLSKWHLLTIFIMTIIILSAEIYYLGYSRVRKKKQRPFGQFWFKRMCTTYCMSIIVCFMIVVLYDIPHTVPEANIANVIHIVIAASFPASIGAALTDLFKKF